MANKVNLGNAIISNSPGDSGTTFEVSGYGDVMPAASFYATATPAGQLSTMGNSEIVLVTAKSTDDLTVTRAQKGTTAQDIAAGWILSNGVYVEDLDEKADESDLTAHTSNTSNPHSVTKAQVGLGNADNTSDANKPVSTAQQTALDGKANSSHTHPTTDLTATGGSGTSYLRKDNTWATPTNTTYSEITTAEIDAGTASTLRTMTGRRAQYLRDLAQNRANHTGTQTASTISDFTSAVQSVLATTFQALLPVGAKWYGGNNSANPSTYIPGMSDTTWVATNVGRFPVGKASSGTFGTAGATGGSETHTHTLDNAYARIWVSDGTGRVFYRKRTISGGSWDSTTASPNGTPFTSATSIPDGTEIGGNTDSGSSLPPYQVEYIWIRTA